MTNVQPEQCVRTKPAQTFGRGCTCFWAQTKFCDVGTGCPNTSAMNQRRLAAHDGTMPRSGQGVKLLVVGHGVRRTPRDLHADSHAC
eukprot:8508093-Alexandrium_andersonii.AAC.1